MSPSRTITRFLLTLVVTVAIAASGLTARAHEPIGFKHEPGSATFTNPNSVAVRVSYGTASSGDVTIVTVPAGKSVTVKSKLKNFGYTARIGTAEVGLLAWPGVDLRKQTSPSVPSTGN